MTDPFTLSGVGADLQTEPFLGGSQPDGREDAVRAPNAVASRDHYLSAGAISAALAYATLRYNIFKGVPWADWPAYTVNKALAVGSLLVITASVLRLVRHGRGSAILLLWGGGLALAHSLLSFAMLNPVYCPRLFVDGKLTALAGLSLTLGTLLVAGLEIGARRAREWSAYTRHVALALIAFGTGVHAALPALPTWIQPETWPGGLPPLTLISFLVGALALFFWFGHILGEKAWIKLAHRAIWKNSKQAFSAVLTDRACRYR